jgi:hypothetical protein
VQNTTPFRQNLEKDGQNWPSALNYARDGRLRITFRGKNSTFAEFA